MSELTKTSISEGCRDEKRQRFRFYALVNWWSGKRSSLPSTMVLLKTTFIFLAYIAIGWSDSLLGANLTQFQLSLESSTQTTCYLLQSSFAGFTTGNFVLSLLSHRMSLPFVQIFSVTTLCITSLFAPHLHDLHILLYTFFTSGFASGLFCGSAISRMLQMWGNESAPILQLLDCTYGIGSIIGPFISRFFLLELTTHILNHGSSVHTSHFHTHGHSENSTNVIMLFLHPHTNETLTRDDLRIVYPYSLLSTYSGICAIALITLYIIQRKDEIHKSRLTNDDSRCESTTNSMVTLPSSEGRDDCESTKASKWPSKELITQAKTTSVVIVASLTYALANGTGMIEQSFITKYVTISNFKLTAAQGATIESSSWVTNVIFGAGSIIVINRFGLEVTLMICAAITASSQIFFMSLLHTGAEWVLWTTVNLVSLGTTPLFGILVAYMESKFPVSSRAAAFYLILNCLGNVTWPIIVSSHIDRWPNIYVYSMATTALTSASLAFVVIILSRIFFPAAKSTYKEKEPEEKETV